METVLLRSGCVTTKRETGCGSRGTRGSRERWLLLLCFLNPCMCPDNLQGDRRVTENQLTTLLGKQARSQPQVQAERVALEDPTTLNKGTWKLEV